MEGEGDEVSPKCDNLQSPLTSILPRPGLMSSQPLELYAPPPPPPPDTHARTHTRFLSLRSRSSHHHCCSFDLIPLTSADLSKRGEGGRGRMRREAYYPSSSALNYLNANDVRGRGREGRRG